MVKIGKKPILWHIIKYYSVFRFSNFILWGGYKVSIIKNYSNGGFQSWLNEHINNKNYKVNILSWSISSLVENKVGLQEYLIRLLK